MRIVTALLAALALHQDADTDKKAAEILQKIEDKVLKAKTVILEFADKQGEGAPREPQLEAYLKLSGKGAFSFKIIEKHRNQQYFFRSDGRTILAEHSGIDAPGPLSKSPPGPIEKALRLAASHANLLAVAFSTTPVADPEKLLRQLKPTDARLAGKEKIGSCEALILSYAIEAELPKLMKFSIRSWIDPEKLVVLKRELNLGPKTITESVSGFSLDEAIPEDEFEFQSARRLKAGLMLQVSRSVELFARFTGRLPTRLEDLAKRPADLAAGAFWPECGFWMGGSIPSDIRYGAKEGFTLWMASSGRRHPLCRWRRRPIA